MILLCIRPCLEVFFGNLSKKNDALSVFLAFGLIYI